MAYVVAGAVLAGAVSLLNLVLTLAVIRRLREHTELLSRRNEGPPEPQVMLAAGEAPTAFEVAAKDGDRITNATHTDHSLVAFMSPGCDACHEQLPDFIAYAERFPGGRDARVAIVVGAGDGSEELITRLEAVARVVEEEPKGAMSTAFGVNGYPAYAVVDGGVIRASGYRVDQLPATTLAV